jgi:site-specific recombinase
VSRLAQSAYVSGALAELGILPEHGLSTELRERIIARVLPSESPPHDLREIVRELVDGRDASWLRALPDALLERVVRAIAPDDPRRPLRFGTLRALELVGHRLAAAGEAPELGRFDPEAREHDSPFLALASEITVLTRRVRESGPEEPTELDTAHAAVMLSQCREATSRLRRRAPRTGVTLRMTYELERLDDLIERAARLLACLRDDEQAWVARATLVREIAIAQAEQERLVPLVGRGLRLVSTEITSRAARTGEHYIARTRGEWLRMWAAAGGAGLVVACMAAMKVAIAAVHAPPLLEALLFSMNYAGGFVLVGMLGMTIATKQPAMTSAALAASIDAAEPRRTRPLVETIQALVRSQLAAILGNCLVALPAAFALSWVIEHVTGAPVATADKAAHLAHDLDPLASLAVPHAALTGVYLSLSGLVAGYVATALSARHVPARIARSASLVRWLGAERAARLGRSLGKDGGTVAGSIVLGLLLGSTGTLGALVGLPVDIRHVSFASANAGLALASVGPGALELGRVGAGIVAIGATNLAVSFGISLSFALAARRCSLADVPGLARDLARAWVFELPAWILPVGPSASSSRADQGSSTSAQ